jgi:hypothetical protein
MGERGSFLLFFTGFIIVMFGVGGIEQSMDDLGLVYGVAVSAIGCLTMWAGVQGINERT